MKQVKQRLVLVIFTVVFTIIFTAGGKFLAKHLAWEVEFAFLLFVGILLGVASFFIIKNFRVLIKKRAPGLTAKKMLFFFFVMSVWFNIALLIKLYIPQVDMSIGSSLFLGVCFAFLANMGVAWILALRKKDELELLGFSLIGVLDPYKDFFDTKDEDRFEKLLKQKKIFKVNAFLEYYIFCRCEDEKTKKEAVKILNRMQVRFNPAESEFFNPGNNDLI